MRTRIWKAEYIGRLGFKYAVDVAAPTFVKAIARVRVAARKRGDRKPHIVSITQTTTLDA